MKDILANFFKIAGTVTFASLMVAPVYAQQSKIAASELLLPVDSLLSQTTRVRIKNSSLLETKPKNIEQYSITDDSAFIESLQKYRQPALFKGITQEFSIPTAYGTRGYSIMPANADGQQTQLEKDVVIIKLGEEPLNQPSFQQGDGIILFNINDQPR
ncbi:MAG: hypothetical protein AAF208_13650 [Cyanobacteria bacterium P01_A01_bin.45]